MDMRRLQKAFEEGFSGTFDPGDWDFHIKGFGIHLFRQSRVLSIAWLSRVGSHYEGHGVVLSVKGVTVY